MKNDKNAQELLKTRKGKAEDKRQQIRKKIEHSSRLLDNYYNPKIHKKFWQPSGTAKQKNTYTYDDTGLGFKIPQEKSQNQNAKNKEQVHFLEFDYIENNEVIVVIEHCSHCEEHQSHTQHINDIFRTIAKLLQKSIVARFPFIKVYLKPIDKESLSSRVGAFEVQMCSKINEKTEITPLFSKLNSGLWPSIFNVLNKISSTLPMVDIKCIIYDKEEGLDNNNSNNDLLPSKYENIKITLYQYNNSKITEYSREAMDQIDRIFNPKRRNEINNEDIFDENMSSPQLNRPMTTRSTMHRPFTSTLSNRPVSSKTSFGDNSLSSYSYISTMSNRTDIIEDVDTITKIKGKMVSYGYSDKEGILIFQNVPYDMFVIEVENNKNFLSCASVIKHTKIQSPQNMINKFFGLRRQIDSYVEVFIYSTKEDNLDVEAVELMTDAKVTINREYDIYSNLEDTFVLKENPNIRGRYEIITSPGKVRLNVSKQGFQPIQKEIELKCGLNTINIQLI